MVARLVLEHWDREHPAWLKRVAAPVTPGSTGTKSTMQIGNRMYGRLVLAAPRGSCQDRADGHNAQPVRSGGLRRRSIVDYRGGNVSNDLVRHRLRARDTVMQFGGLESALPALVIRWRYGAA